MSAAPQLAPDPHTELARIPATVARLRASFDAGRTRPLAWRREQLSALKAMVTERGEEFERALAADFRKPAFEAHAFDVAQANTEAALALKKLSAWTKPERIGSVPLVGRGRVIREPLGVVLIIAPWNYPVGLLLSPLVGAVAAGNAVVLKPSEITAHTSEVLARLVPQYLDSEAISLVEGGVEETSALLEERFDHIFYTGSGHVGRIVMQAAAKHLTPVTLELGGKSPCIVLGDAPIETTARRIAWGKFVNAGQTCIAPDYLLVEESKQDELVAAIGRVVGEFYGADPKTSESYARISSQRQFDRLAGLLKEGEAAFGGQTDASERYIAPTVLRGVSADSAVMQSEIFGPILPVLPIRGVEQAISFVNAREKPLALYLFTEDEDAEEQLIARTSSGGACVNGTIVHITDPRLPFGGVGPSGTGAYHGRHTFETFSHRKSVMTRGFRFDPKLLYPPYTKRKTKLAKLMM